MGSSRAIATLLTGALVAAPGVGRAQPAPSAPTTTSAPTAAQKQQAGDLVKRAIAKAQSGGFTEAIDLYLQAYAILPEPVLLSNVGAAYQQMNKPADAVTYFCKYLEVDPDGNNASYALAQAKQLQAQLGNAGNTDDKTACAKPRASEPAPPSPTTPSDTTGTRADARDIDTPASGASEASTAPGHGFQIAGATIAGIGAVGLVLGIVYGVKAQNLSNEISHQKMGESWPDTIQQIQADGKSDQNKQIGFLVGGGALFAGGALLFLLLPRRHASESLSIAPIASPTSVGLAVGGGF